MITSFAILLPATQVVSLRKVVEISQLGYQPVVGLFVGFAKPSELPEAASWRRPAAQTVVGCPLNLSKPRGKAAVSEDTLKNKKNK